MVMGRPDVTRWRRLGGVHPEHVDSMPEPDTDQQSTGGLGMQVADTINGWKMTAAWDGESDEVRLTITNPPVKDVLTENEVQSMHYALCKMRATAETIASHQEARKAQDE